MKTLKKNKDIKDKRLASFILYGLLIFLGYLIYVFSPVWAMSFFRTEGVAYVETISNDEYIIYKYFNKYKNTEIKLKREIDNSNYWDAIKEEDKLKMEYPKYFPNHVVFESVDTSTSLVFTLIVFVLTLLSIWLYWLVIKGKISIKTLLGIN